MSHETLVEDQAFFVFHTPGASRHEAGKEVCDALEQSNPVLLGRQRSTEWEVEAWFLANPDLAYIDGNDRRTDETTLTYADQLHAPGCHAILVGFDTRAPAGVPSAGVVYRALSVAAVVRRYAPTEVGPSLSPDQHLVDALIARAARLTAEERAELIGHIEPAELPTYDTMIDFDRGFGHKIAPPPTAREVNRAWSRAVAALGGHAGDRQLEFAVGAAAGALAIRSQIGGWDRWDTAEYLALTHPWREVIGPLHSDDSIDASDAWVRRQDVPRVVRDPFVHIPSPMPPGSPRSAHQRGMAQVWGRGCDPRSVRGQGPLVPLLR